MANTENIKSLKWIPLQQIAQLDKISEISHSKPCVIFKHSTRCSISSMAKFRLEENWNIDNAKVSIYYLDLIQYRNISNSIAEVFSVHHQSPQLLLIQKGECTYESSHLDITVDELQEQLN